MVMLIITWLVILECFRSVIIGIRDVGIYSRVYIVFFSQGPNGILRFDASRAYYQSIF